MEYLYKEMNVMESSIKKMVGHLNKIINERGRIVVRYHNDADGISSALLMYRMFRNFNINATFVQNNSAIYGMDDALRDIMYYDMGTHFIFLDFGNNLESLEGINILKRDAGSIAIIDHHLTGKEKNENEIIVTPVYHELGGEYTAGLVTYEVVKRVADIDYDDLYKISLYGDKSILEFEKTKKVEETALVFDYIASTIKRDKHSIRFIDSLLEDEELMHTIYLKAKDRVDELSRMGLDFCKRKDLNNKIHLVTLDVEKIIESGSNFPSRGKITGKIHDIIEQEIEGPLVVLGYSNDTAMFRANRKAVLNGFNANDIIQDIKKNYDRFVESGGGHPGAAAIRYKKGFKKVILNALIEKINNIGEKI
jgi:RecJ-like exonuclease